MLGLSIVAVGCGSTTGSDGFISGPEAPASLANVLGRVSSQDLFRFDSFGNLFVLKPPLGKVERLNEQGTTLWSAGQHGIGPTDLNTPVSLDSDTQRRIWVLDRGLSRLLRLSPQGAVEGVFGEAFLSLPQDLRFANASLFVSDALHHRIAVVGLDGALSGEIRSSELSYPLGLAIDPQGRLHVANRGALPILVFSPQGQLLGSYGQFGFGAGAFLHLRGLAIRTLDGLIAAADPVQGDIEFFDSAWRSLGSLEIPGLQPRRLTFAPTGELFVFGDPK